MTDLVWEKRLEGLDHGVHTRNKGGISADQDVFLTVSLAGAFGGSCYKLVAAVIPM